MDKATFRARFGSVYEHSPWVADAVFDTGIELATMDADALSACFSSVFLDSDRQRQLETLQAHPELACAQAQQSDLTESSRREQTGAGLDQCTESELKQFIEMNYKYLKYNNFPFIISVKGRTRQEILTVFHERLNNDPDSEFETALQEVCQIGRFRIGEILAA